MKIQKIKVRYATEYKWYEGVIFLDKVMRIVKDGDYYKVIFVDGVEWKIEKKDYERVIAI